MTSNRRAALVCYLNGKSISVADGLRYFGISDNSATAASEISSDLFQCVTCRTWKWQFLNRKTDAAQPA